MLNDILEKIARREDLTAAEMATAVGAFVDHECEPAQIAGFLMALRVKGETVDELVGAAMAFRDRAVRLPDTVRPVLCTAGTGGDRMGSINLSTAAALIAAAAGVPVAKHGNRSVSSRCGSADVLDALGVPTGLSPQGAAAAIQDSNFGFLFAPHYHPAMKSVAPGPQGAGGLDPLQPPGPAHQPGACADASRGRFPSLPYPLHGGGAVASGS